MVIRILEASGYTVIRIIWRSTIIRVIRVIGLLGLLGLLGIRVIRY